MVDKNKQNSEANDAKRFYKELNKANPDFNILVGFLNKHPDILISKEFLMKAFPNRCSDKNSLGKMGVQKVMKTMKRLKAMEQKGLLSSEQLNAFYSAQHPSTGETLSTLYAKNAVAAHEKATADRSPKPNFSDKDRAKFAKQEESYTNALAEMQKLGVPLDAQNQAGQSAASIAHPLIANKAQDKGKVDSLIANEVQDFEVGGQDKPALKASEKNKPLVVKESPQQKTDPQNVATVEDAPEEDKGKGDKIKFDPVKEQDIIDYMYNAWFLGGLNWCMEGIINMGNKTIDDLANRAHKNYARSKDDKQVKLEEGVKNYADKGKDVLSGVPQRLTQQFTQGLDAQQGFMNRLGEEIRSNMGKSPQEWNMLHPESNPTHKKLVDNLNASYASNPKDFEAKLSALTQERSLPKQVMARIYNLSAQMATVQYMQKEMNKNGSDFHGEKMVDIEKEIAKRASHNFTDLLSAINNGAELARIDMLNAGITDKTAISNSSAQMVEEFLKTAEIRTADAKASLIGDLEQGNFKLNSGKLSKTTMDNFDAMSEVTNEGDKLATMLSPDLRKKYEMTDLKQEARQVNADMIREKSFMEDFMVKSQVITSSKEDLDKRKEPVTAARKKIMEQSYISEMQQRPSYQNRDTNSSSIINNLIVKNMRSNNSEK